MIKKTIYIHTDTTDQFGFDDIGDALNYIEDMIDEMANEAMVVYVKTRTGVGPEQTCTPDAPPK